MITHSTLAKIMSHSRQVLTREKRIRLFQIDCASDILFSDWHPDGRVYTQQFVMKNVSRQLLTLTYKLPEKPQFFTPFPDQIVLPIGMEHTIDVSFQPTAAEELFSELVFTVNQFNEEFRITLRGELPLLSAKTNLDVIFPTATGVQETLFHDEKLTNDGEIPFLFEFTLPESTEDIQQPYTITPSQGLLNPSESAMIRYTFQPVLSGQFVTRPNLRIKKTNVDQLSKREFIDQSIKLSAIAKFPMFCIKFDDQIVNQLIFQQALIIQEHSKQIYVVNQSNVAAHFDIIPQFAHDAPYNQLSIQPSSGFIEANGEFPITIKYQPRFTSCFNRVGAADCAERTEYDETSVFVNRDPQDMQFSLNYSVRSRSTVSTDFEVLCNSIPAQLELSHTKIDFGVVQCGTSAQKSIYVKNISKLDCYYQMSFEGFINFTGSSLLCKVDPRAIECDKHDLTLPSKRKISRFPFQVSPSSGVALSQINTSIVITCDFTNFTSMPTSMLDGQSSGKSYVPPQPISFYIQLKAPGSPVQFVHVTATLLPEDGIDSRPAPITMDYAENFQMLRRTHTIDELIGMMVPSQQLGAAAPTDSPLYDSTLPEFQTEYTHTAHYSEQAVTKSIKLFNIHDIEQKPAANSLLPSDSLLEEFQGKQGISKGYGAEISHRHFNFGFVAAGSQKSTIISAYNNSETLPLFVGLTGAQIGDSICIQFLGLSENSQFESSDLLSPSHITDSDGLEYIASHTRGMVIKIPPQQYAFYEITIQPSQNDMYYLAKYAFLMAHQPLLLYRCFRHAIVGYSITRELTVCGVSRSQQLPALSSSVPVLSKPIINNSLLLPPTAPGAVTRQSFAMTNPGTSCYVVSVQQLENDFVHIYPQIFALQAGQTVIVSIAITFPADSITARERYGFTTSKQSTNTVEYDDLLKFNINNSDLTCVEIKLQSVCSGLDVVYNQLEKDIQAFSQVQTPENIQIDMAPVSLCAESARLISLTNKSLLPIEIISKTTSQRDEELMYISPGLQQFDPCKHFDLKYVFKALDKYVVERSYQFNMELIAQIPRQYCLPVPNNMYQCSLIPNFIEQHQQLFVNTSVARRTVEITPKTINLKNVVPYTPVDIQLNIYNASHCSVCYSLEVHEMLAEFPPLDFEGTRKVLRKYAYVSAKDTGDYLVPRLYNELYDPEGVMSDVEQKRCPQIYIKSGAGGIILPRSSQQITISVFPFSVQAVRARIFAKIVEINMTDQTYSEILKNLEEQAVYLQGTISAFQQYYAQGIDQNRMFECKLEVEADYPRFFISDISCPKIGSSQLRDILNVDLINEFLAGEVTMKERIYGTPGLKRERLLQKMQQLGEMREDLTLQNYEKNSDIDNQSAHSSGRLDIEAPNIKQLTSENDVLRNNTPKDELLLTEFSLLLGPDNQSPDRSYFVVLTLSNPSEIACDVSFDLPQGPELGDVPWFQQMPSVQQQRTMSLLARKIYSVAPQELHLAPFTKQCVTINYAHIEEGVHELSVLARIRGGRSFFLHLIGSTLAKFEPALIAPMEQKLLPVALGEQLPPRQFLKVHNPGNVYVQYQLTNPQLVFDILDNNNAINNENQFENNVNAQAQLAEHVIDCLNPVGVLAPDSSTNIAIQFHPKQVGLVHVRYDMQIRKIQPEDFAAFRQTRRFFQNEANADLPCDQIGDIDMANVARQNAIVNDGFFECNEIYQQIDIFAYGFLRNTKIPVQLLPSYCKNGTPLQPACGAVSLTNIRASNFVTQRGLGYCALSCGRVVLGAVPTFSSITTLIDLEGLPQEEPGYYEWHTGRVLENAELQIKIEPNKGRLDQGEKIPVCITVSTGALPAAFLEDLPFYVQFIKEEKLQTMNHTTKTEFMRLPAVLANTVSSAARISETAILQQFDPSQLNRAGLDQQTRQAHAMLYGVEDRVSSHKIGPLSLYQYIPTEDILWLTLSIHSHRTEALQCYNDTKFGLSRNEAAVITRTQIKPALKAKTAELNEEDTELLQSIVVGAMKGAVNNLISNRDQCETLINRSQKTQRNALNGLQKANFFALAQDDLINVVDTQSTQQLQQNVKPDQFVDKLSSIFINLD